MWNPGTERRQELTSMKFLISGIFTKAGYIYPGLIIQQGLGIRDSLFHILFRFF